MTIIQRNALVPYSTRQMFELVNNIEDYPRFLPWCSGCKILSQTDQVVEATLEIVWSGIHKSFTTRNTLYPVERMDMKLVEGPFRQLEGRWGFMPLGEQGCKVHMELEFELAGGFMDKLFQPIFNNIANSLVDAFCKRAVEVYGNR
jgi:ribosome-associated toxin RatA of RatAB toxin-antitoxin module